MLTVKEMLELLERAKEELKRADHLMYVSLKYTRTVDVIKSLIERLINAFDFGVEALLKKAKVRDIPKIPRVKVEMLEKIHSSDEKIRQYMQLYLLLRDINKAPFERAMEFRRHVLLTAHLDDKEIEVDIDIAEDYVKATCEFIEYAERIIKG